MDVHALQNQVNWPISAAYSSARSQTIAEVHCLKFTSRVYLLSVPVLMQLSKLSSSYIIQSLCFMFFTPKLCVFVASFMQAKSPHEAVLFTNRALCHLKLGQWTLVVEDCQKALQLDSILVKAHFFLGQALIELENYDDAILSLKTGTCDSLVHKLKIVLSCNKIVSPHSKCHTTKLLLNTSQMHEYLCETFM